MDSKEIQNVWVLATFDTSDPLGSTEPYYIVQKIAKKWDTHIFAPNSGSIDSAHEHQLPATSLGAVVLLNFILIPQFIWYCLRRPPDLVYVYKDIFTPVLIAKILTDATIIYDLRSDPYDQSKEFETKKADRRIYHLMLYFGYRLHRFTLPRIDGVITLSEELAERIQANYGVPRDRIGLIPLAADPQKFAPVDSNNERLQIVYLGSLAEFRGLDDLVIALASLDPQQKSRVRLDIYGEASDHFINELESLCPEGPPIEWHGYVEHELLAESAAACDIAVSPLPALDSFKLSSPAKIYEYIALGLPIVATNITPHKRILNENCAVFVPPSEPQAMTEAFARLIDDDEYRSQLGIEARQIALENTWEDRFEGLCDYVENWQTNPSEANS
ncbi:Glycosyltransferase involved in cell wall bisynthesis [Halorubrum ezzemoulense]|uniref:Glycosyltransferase involved in cell wall bisynthesis n=1 Tax=Halorubrum ezzemoulense TaxID=337243 RepID=A0A238YJK4_HALEZ|nr:glycosyltransferase [Halorubrum ezzemoulense]SNR71307.1 Glycosyltransferase involved in cell wall bisynthesis [Halorubrum ezzemoulense]